MENLDEFIGGRIRAIRTGLGITQAELARKANVAKPTISNLENGRYSGVISTLAQIAEALGCSITSFLPETVNVKRVYKIHQPPSLHALIVDDVRMMDEFFSKQKLGEVFVVEVGEMTQDELDTLNDFKGF
jgi:transcriptional regulator with XRE-family HTH domain